MKKGSRLIKIEAMHFVDEYDSSRIAKWLGGSNAESPRQVRIPHPTGEKIAVVGDFIFKTTDGNVHLVAPKDFLATLKVRVVMGNNQIQRP